MQELFSLLFMPAVLLFFMYFLLIMPQRKRMKKEREMRSALKEGDNIVTAGGIIGKIVNIKDDDVTIETSVERTQIKVTRWSVNEVQKVKEE